MSNKGCKSRVLHFVYSLLIGHYLLFNHLKGISALLNCRIFKHYKSKELMNIKIASFHVYIFLKKLLKFIFYFITIL